MSKCYLFGLGILLFQLLPEAWGEDPNTPLRPENYPNPIRVSCVGDSITQGIRTRIMRLDCYPSQLQRLLGPKWQVNNFGIMSKTLLLKGDQPYQSTRTFQEALKSNPDVVIIGLGTNDCKDQNWQHKADFINDYKNLIEQFKVLPSHPRIFICHPPPLPKEGQISIPPGPIDDEIPMIDAIAQEERTGVIDLHTPLLDHMELITDRIHPGTEGSYILAKTVYHALTGSEFTGQIDPFLRSNWKGYDRIEFAVGNRLGYLIQPKTPAAGKPWSWRSVSMDLDEGLDLPLLEKGWFLGGAETSGGYGLPAALDSMDEYYNFVVQNFQLSPKPALKGYDKGGLAAINWAVRHPAQVSSLYFQGALLNLKSYSPGKSSAKEWENLKKEYHFVDAAAVQAYPRNPIDQLKPLVEAKIPIFGVSGESHQEIPPGDNISLLGQRYKALGGEIQIVLIPGEDRYNWGLKDHTPAVDFILKHGP